MTALLDPPPTVTPGRPRGDLVRAGRRRRARRSWVVGSLLAAALLGAVCVALSLGSYAVPVPDVVRALVGRGTPVTDLVVLDLRLPRVLVGLLAGAAFALSGATFQTLVGNPLASPDFIGITAGASAAAVVALLVLDLDGYLVSLAALVGGLLTALAIYVLAWSGGVTAYRLILVGIAVSALLASVVSYLLTRAQVYDAQEALIWLTGSLNGSTWPTVQVLALATVVLVPLSLGLGRQLLTLQLGDDAARAVGSPVERARLAVALVAVALAAVATAAAGPVAFVALVSGPLARRLVGPHGTGLVPAALVGALVVVVSDVVAQHGVPGQVFPVGVVTGIVGAPYLIWLLATAHRRTEG